MTLTRSIAYSPKTYFTANCASDALTATVNDINAIGPVPIYAVITTSENLHYADEDLSLYETVKITAKDVGSSTITIERAIEGGGEFGAGLDWEISDLIACFWTAAAYEDFRTAINEHVQNTTTAHGIDQLQKGYPVTSPTDFNAGIDNESSNLTWVNPSDREVKDENNVVFTVAEFDYVEIYRNDGSDIPTKEDYDELVYSGSNQNYTDTELTNGQEYNYTIYAITTTGVYSDPVSDNVIPAAYTMDWEVGTSSFEVNRGNSKAFLSWNNPGGDFAGVLIRRSTTAYPTAIDEGTQVYDGTAENYTDESVNNDQIYYYTIWAYNNSNQYSADGYQETDSVTPVEYLMDWSHGVTGTSANIDDEQITLTWSNPDEADFQGVLIKRSTSAYPTTIHEGDEVYDGALETYTDTELTNGTAYFYTIWAYNEDSSTRYSDGANKVEISATPAAFTMDWEHGVTGASVASDDTELTLSWSNPDELGFEGVLIRRSESAYPTAINEGTEVYDGSGETVVDDGLVNDTEYFYTIWAYNDSNQYSDNSNKVEITGTPVAISAILSENSWSKIKIAADYISEEELTDQQVEDTYGWQIGDEIDIELEDEETYTFQIYAFNHDDLHYEDGKAGITFGMKDCMDTTRRMMPTNDNDGGWQLSEMRNKYIKDDFHAGLPNELKSVIRTIDKKAYNKGNQGGRVIAISDDDCFLFSAVEVGTETSEDYANEGFQYDIFTDNASRIKKVGASASDWWLRSPASTNTTVFRHVSTTGGSFGSHASDSGGAVVGFGIGGGGPKYITQSWSEIETISDNGEADQYFNIGDYKFVECADGNTYTFQIYGFDHDDVTGTSNKAGITFGMKDCMFTIRRMEATNTNANGWDGSEMRGYINSTFYNGLPTALKNVIKTIDKKTYNKGSQSGRVIAISNDDCFLFSAVEVGTETSGDYANEGFQYDIFTNNASRIKKISGASNWWLRSPLSTHTPAFRIVDTTGGSTNSNASTSLGAVVGFGI